MQSPRRRFSLSVVGVVGVVALAVAGFFAWRGLAKHALDLEVTVLRAGKPVPDAVILVDPLEPLGAQLEPRATDHDGRFELIAPPSWFRVIANYGDGCAVALFGPDRPGRVDLELRALGALDLELSALDGGSLDNPQVRLIEPIDDLHAAERVLYAGSVDSADDRPEPGTELERVGPRRFRGRDLTPGTSFVWVRAEGVAETFVAVKILSETTSRESIGVGPLTPLIQRPADPAGALMAELLGKGFSLLGRELATSPTAPSAAPRTP